ncbi:hypothetical protein KCP77_08805 [Salmonella enterica subsp. enterica]|nr:hypothetical protein KCP77_08805 [Salmonella enterica subsp. enterica]
MFLRQWVLIKLTVIAPLAVLGALSARSLYRAAIRKRNWRRLCLLVSENRETVVAPDSVCRDRKNSRHSHRHPLWDAYDGLHRLWPLLPGAQPVPAIASLTSPMMKIPQRGDAAASGQLHGAGL